MYLLPPSGRDSREIDRRQGRNGTNGGAVNTRRVANSKSNGKNTKWSGQSNGKTGKSGTTESNGGKKERGSGNTYAKIVTKNGWTTVPKKRKYDSVSPKAAFPLLGIPSTVNRNVYLQGLRMSNGVSEEDVVDSIRMYCIERNITPVFIRIIPVKFDDNENWV